VLGEAATPALLDAWAEAYGSLAKLLIDTEQALYQQAGVQPGATRPMNVVQVKRESADVLAITLEADDGGPAPAFKPGQYVSVAVDFADGRRQLRQYSLSDAPNGRQLRISVKREPAGAASPAGEVSNWIHAHVKVGGVLQVSHPFGDFTPDTASSQPIVLLSAGVGITPMISVLNEIARSNPGREVVFAHAARNADHHAHQQDLAAALAVMPGLRTATFYEDVDGRMEAARLPEWQRDQADVYLCGPAGFMQAQWRGLLEAGVPVQRLHREVFGPELLNF
jgi:nitric oxide dioxygenase